MGTGPCTATSLVSPPTRTKPGDKPRVSAGGVGRPCRCPGAPPTPSTKLWWLVPARRGCYAPHASPRGLPEI